MIYGMIVVTWGMYSFIVEGACGCAYPLNGGRSCQLTSEAFFPQQQILEGLKVGGHVCELIKSLNSIILGFEQLMSLFHELFSRTQNSWAHGLPDLAPRIPDFMSCSSLIHFWRTRWFQDLDMSRVILLNSNVWKVGHELEHVVSSCLDVCSIIILNSVISWAHACRHTRVIEYLIELMHAFTW